MGFLQSRVTYTHSEPNPELLLIDFCRIDKFSEKVRRLSFICTQRREFMRIKQETLTLSLFTQRNQESILTLYALSDSHLYLPDVTTLNLKSVRIEWKQTAAASLAKEETVVKTRKEGGPGSTYFKRKMCLKCE